MSNRIWLEIEPPKDVEPALRNEVATARAAAATQVLRKLGSETSEFRWNASEQCYIIYQGGTYWDLEDHGYWFNLDYMAA